MSDVKEWGHQRKFIDLAKPLPGCAAFFDMGCGKTYAAIRELCEEMNLKKRMFRVLVFTKSLVVPQFREEWLKFSKLTPAQVTCLDGAGKKRISTFGVKGFAGDIAQSHVFVTNYESLLMKDLLALFERWAPDAIIWDESDELKNHQSLRSKLAYTLANPWDKKNKQQLHKPKTLLLTGTPVLNQPLDIFQQVKVMLGGWPREEWFRNYDRQFLIENFFHFRARYFYDKNAGMGKDSYFPKWELMTLSKHGFDANEEIRRTLERISVRVAKAECLDLPEEVSRIVKLPMAADQARVYKDMQKDFISYVQGKACVADVAIVKALRLMQIASGFCSLQGIGEEQDKAEVRFASTPKDEMLEELLTSITPTSKVLVWAVWQENYAQIRRVCEKVGVRYVEIHGQISDVRKKQNVEDFKVDPAIRVCLGHPGSGGIGLNLTCAPYSIYYSRNFSLRQYLQSRARNHRAGQTEKVTHYDLVCENSVDELVLKKLEGKIEIGAKLLGDLAKELAQAK